MFHKGMYVAGPVADRFQIHARLAAVLIILTTAVEVLLFFIPEADIIQQNTANSSQFDCDNHTTSHANLTMPCLLDQLVRNGNRELPTMVERNLCSHILSLKDGYVASSLCSVSILNSSDSKVCDKISPSIPEQRSQKISNSSLEYRTIIMCQNKSILKMFCMQCHVNQTETNSNNSGNTSNSVVLHRKYTETFWMYLIVYCTANLIAYPIWSLINAVAYGSLGEDRNTWGRHRLWGMSYAIHSVILHSRHGLHLHVVTVGVRVRNRQFFSSFPSKVFCKTMAR